jgi:hypothetical protein
MICLEDKPNLTLLCCGAVYHFDCLHRWLSVSAGGNNNGCAQCRGAIPNTIRQEQENIRRQARQLRQVVDVDTTSASDHETTAASDTIPISEDDATSNANARNPHAEFCARCRTNKRAHGCAVGACGRCCLGLVRERGTRCIRHLNE